MSTKTATASQLARLNLFELERTALRDLTTLVESRAAAETAAKSAHDSGIAAAEKELSRARKQNSTGRERDLAALTEAHQEMMKKIAEQYKADSDAAEAEFLLTKQRVTEECDGLEGSARTAYQDSRWTADSIYEAAEKQSADDRDEQRRKATATADRVADVWRQAEAPLARAGLAREDVEAPTSEAA